MEPIRTFSSKTVLLPIDNVDTDQIIPARFLKVTSKQGLGKQLFADWRYDAAGSPNPTSSSTAPRRRGDGAGGRRQLRLRLVPRARPLGPARLRLPRRGQHHHRRHLPQQLAEERALARSWSSRRSTRSCWPRLARR
jgi:hypothetical protein